MHALSRAEVRSTEPSRAWHHALNALNYSRLPHPVFPHTSGTTDAAGVEAHARRQLRDKLATVQLAQAKALSHALASVSSSSRPPLPHLHPHPSLYRDSPPHCHPVQITVTSTGLPCPQRVASVLPQRVASVLPSFLARSTLGSLKHQASCSSADGARIWRVASVAIRPCASSSMSPESHRSRPYISC